MKLYIANIGCSRGTNLRPGINLWAGILLALVVGLLSAMPSQAQTVTYTLGRTSVLVGPTAGSNSVALAVSPATGTWTASTNAIWLHLTAANQSGTGSTNVVFSYDANTGATRNGSLTLGGQTVTITQAGSTYVSARPLTTLVSNGLNSPWGVDVDTSGNIYIADQLNNAIKKWIAASDTVITLVSNGLDNPSGVSVDKAGNVYITDGGDNEIKKWIAASNEVVVVVSNGLDNPYRTALDASTNVYIANFNTGNVLKWITASSTLITLVASSNLDGPTSVSVDVGGNVYISSYFNNEIKELVAVNSNLLTLFSPLVSGPNSVVVDGGGNLFTSDNASYDMEEWLFANRGLATLVSNGLNTPQDLALDAAGDIFIADRGDNAVKELPYAFVVPNGVSEGAAAGSDSLPVVLPTNANLNAPFTPTSSQSWLTITGTAAGVVGFSFTANTTTNSRTATITLLGQPVQVTQQASCITINWSNTTVHTCDSCTTVPFNATVSDPCCTNGVTLSYSPSSNTCFNVNTTNLVQVTATDGCGGNATNTYLVAVLPENCSTNCISIQWSNITVHTCDNCTTVPFTATASDSCCSNGATITYSPPSNTCFNVNTTNFVQVIASDICGNSVTNTYTVTVLPENCSTNCISIQWSNTTVQTCYNCTTVPFTARATDTCCSNVTLTYNYSSNTCFAVNTLTAVKVTASDACGNSVTNTYTVTVEGENCGSACISLQWSNTVVYTCENCTTVPFTATASDSCCSGVSIGYSISSNYCFPVNTTNVVQVTASDNCGSSVSHYYTVAVLPQNCSTNCISIQWSNTVATTCSNCTTVPFTATATDYCCSNNVTLTYTPGSNTCFPANSTNQVQVVASDICDNVVTNYFTVTVNPMLQDITLVQWTFEVSQPSATEAANTWITNISPEFGQGTASALHQNTTAYTSPTGDGSFHSFASSNWAVGDFYQFACSTVNASAITVAWDQVSSATGPGHFQFQYSIDGANFVNFSTYTAGDNGDLSGPTAYWSATTYNGTTHYTENLSAISALNNAATVWFRLVDASTNSANGASVGAFGVDRVDNFTVLGMAPAPCAPAITWANPGQIYYGTPLTNEQLNATADTPGTFTYLPPAGTVLRAGSNTLTAIFTPSCTNCIGATNTVTLIVLPALLTVTANNAARIQGLPNPAFTGSIFGLVNGDNITATYSCNASNSSPPGDYAIVPVIFDPSNSLPNYTLAINDGTLTISAEEIQESVLAQWTFNSSRPYANEPGGVWYPNIIPEIGNGVASAFHQAATTYTNPVGNGSSNSFSANNWSVGDFYQFTCATAGAWGLSVSWDQISSYTGPGQFQFQYSLDGVNFTSYGPPYSVQPNGSLSGATNFWSSQVYNSTTHYVENLSFLNLVGPGPHTNIVFRLADVSTVSADGGSVGPYGASRVDNVTVLGLVTNACASPCIVFSNVFNVVTTACTCLPVSYPLSARSTCCSNTFLTFSPSNNVFCPGTTNLITCTATDCDGNCNTTNFYVAVLQGSCPSNCISIHWSNTVTFACSNCTTIPFTATATDPCCTNGTPTLYYFINFANITSNYCFPVPSTNQIEVVAVDSCNSAVTNFYTVTVLQGNCPNNCTNGFALTNLSSNNISAASLQLQRNSGAALVNNAQNIPVLRLTSAAKDKVGSAFVPVQLGGDASFSTAFAFQMTDGGGPGALPVGADGIVFVLAAAPTDIGLIGTDGGAAGYRGIGSSVGIKFDTYQDPANPFPQESDPNGNFVAIYTDGSVDTAGYVPYSNTSAQSQYYTPPTSMKNGDVWYAWIDYNGLVGLMDVYLSDANPAQPPSPQLSQFIGLNNLSILGFASPVYAGFTAATGDQYQNQDILNWSFSTPCTNACLSIECSNITITTCSNCASVPLSATPISCCGNGFIGYYFLATNSTQIPSNYCFPVNTTNIVGVAAYDNCDDAVSNYFTVTVLPGSCPTNCLSLQWSNTVIYTCSNCAMIPLTATATNPCCTNGNPYLIYGISNNFGIVSNYCFPVNTTNWVEVVGFDGCDDAITNYYSVIVLPSTNCLGSCLSIQWSNTVIYTCSNCTTVPFTAQFFNCCTTAPTVVYYLWTNRGEYVSIDSNCCFEVGTTNLVEVGVYDCSDYTNAYFWVTVLPGNCSSPCTSMMTVGNSLTPSNGYSYQQDYLAGPLVILGEYSSAGPLGSSTKLLPAGTVQDVRFDSGGLGYDFTLYALSYAGSGPGPNEQQFTVEASQTFSSSSSASGVLNLPVTQPFTVSAGSLIAFAGWGPVYPQTGNDGFNSDATYQSKSDSPFEAFAPTLGETFSVGVNSDESSTYQYISNYYTNQGRTYVIAVDICSNPCISIDWSNTVIYTSCTNTNGGVLTSTPVVTDPCCSNFNVKIEPPLHPYALNSTNHVVVLVSDDCGNYLTKEFEIAVVSGNCCTNFGPNLVPNPDFEGYTTCPNNISEFNLVQTWFNPTAGTPDYFNACANNSAPTVGVPNNLAGSCTPLSGDAYAGAIMISAIPGYFTNYREYIEVPLLAPLQSGDTYLVSFYVCLGTNASNCGLDDIGAYLSAGAETSDNTLPLAVTPQVRNPAGNFLTSTNWTLIQGSYLALGGEQYLTIGNFYTDSNTPIVPVIPGSDTTSGAQAYYYIDDVSITENLCVSPPCANPCVAFANVNNITTNSCSCVPVYFTNIFATDTCCTNTNSAVTLTFSPTNGSFFSPGTTNLVTCTATSACGNCNTTNFIVTVLPGTNCPTNCLSIQWSNTVIYTCSNCTTIPFTATATNPCCTNGNPYLLYSLTNMDITSNYCFAVNSTTMVQVVAFDNCDNVVTNFYTVTVLPCATNSCISSCIHFSNVFNVVTNSCTCVPVIYPLSAFSSCCSNVVLNFSPSNYFCPGTTNLVTCTATDCDSNCNTTNFYVTVLPNTNAPMIDCPSNIVVETACTTAQVYYDVSASSQYCSNVTLTVTPPSGSFFPVGTNWVTVVAMDCCGNSNVCNFTVTVIVTNACVAGQIWINQSNAPSTAWISVASSSDGIHLVAGTSVQGGGIYTSADGGQTWTPQTNGLPSRSSWVSVASSSNGVYLVAAADPAGGSGGGEIYTSINSGATWTQQSSGLPFTPPWRSVTSSADGTHLVAASSWNGSVGGMYASTDSGATWTELTSGLPSPSSTYWSSVASSSDGTHLVAVVLGGQIYTSANSGATWAEQTSGLPGSANWSSVASSSDGTHLVTVVNGGWIYTSANSGTTWAEETNGLPSSASWYSVASSSDGTHLVAVDYGGGIYTSANSGANWTESSAPTENWNSVASSSDGTHLVAVVLGGQIYTSDCTPAPCCVPPPTNMVLWLPFDETNGNIHANLASPADPGVQFGNPIHLEGQYVDNSLMFTGTNYVVVPNYTNLEIGTSNLTIDAWVNCTGIGTNFVIVDKLNTNNGVGYRLSLYPGLGLFFNMTGDQQFVQESPVTNSEWHFVAVSVNQNPAAPYGYFYLDGAVVGQTFTPTPASLLNTNALWVAASPYNFPPGGNAPAQPWIGALDEVEVYSRALSTNELNAIYASGTAGKCKPCCYLTDISIALVPNVSPAEVQVTWGGCGNLESTTNLLSPWTTIPNAASPYITPATGVDTFYRLQCPFNP